MGEKGVRTLLKLRIPSADLKEEYAKRYLNGLVERVKDNNSFYVLSPEAKDILLPRWNTPEPDNSRLKKLLINEPVALKRLNDTLTEQLNAIADASAIPSKNTLLQIFGYERIFNSSSKSEAFWLSKQIDCNTCV